MLHPASFVDSQSRLSFAARLRELYGARLLVRAFILQDFKLKYRRSAIGFLWAFINPLLMLVVISVAFSFAFGDGEGNYTLHLMASLFPWLAFAQTFEESSRAIVSAEHVLRQFYFPKLVFPLRRALFRICEFILFLSALIPVALFLGLEPGIALTILPLSILNLFLFSFGVGAIGSVLVVHFRDAEHLISVFLRAWFYLTPIIIPISRVPEEYHKFVKLNPLYYVIEMFEAPIARGQFPSPEVIATATVIACLLAGVGLMVFFLAEDRLIHRL